MNRLVDPDRKVNMSLDDIIHLWNIEPEINKTVRRKPRRLRNHNNDSNNNEKYTNHSVPLHIGGGSIYVTKKSPLLRAMSKREFIKGVSNRVLNGDLLRKKNKIIPAKYELVKTNFGVERILVPASTKFNRRRKRKKNQNLNLLKTWQNTESQPPLMPIPNDYFSTIGSFFCNRKEVKIEESDDEVMVLEERITPNRLHRNPLVVDVESNKLLNFFDKPTKTTLHERFSMLGSINKM